jgi:hypothetical protein
MWMVSLLADGLVVVERRVGPGTFRIGRDPASDLVLDDALASWSHAMLLVDGDRVEVHDDRSTNGTWVDEERVTGPVALTGEETLRVGSTLLRVRRVGTSTETRWMLVDAEGAARVPLDAEVFRVGGADEDDLRVPGATSTVVLVRRSGEIWLEGAPVPLGPGAEVRVGHRRFRVEPASAARVPTALGESAVYPYVAEARRNGPHGPVASLSAPGGARYAVDAGNRAVLLYLLAKRVAEDEGAAPDERGWCDEHEIQRGVWGRDGDQNKLDVLLYRLRRELGRAGLDPWCVEKRHRQLRLRAAAAIVRD